MQLTKDDVELLRKRAAEGNLHAQYGLARWIYYTASSDTSMSEAEELLLKSKNYVPDALAAYAQMWRYGETKENEMDIAKSNKLMQKALNRNSERAAQQLARYRIFGLFCEAEPEAVAQEIEQRLKTDTEADSLWHTLLGHAYTELEKRDEAISQYEQALTLGERDAYLFLAATYQQRGNMALSDSLMEEGCNKGASACMIYEADTKEEDYETLTEQEQQRLHHNIDERLHRGMQMGDGTCAFYLWLHNYYGGLGYEEDVPKAMSYLQRGIQLGDTSCITTLAQMADDDELPAGMALTPTERGELWLRAARYSPHDEETLRGLQRVCDPAFLLKHKGELEQYWQPLFAERSDEEEPEEDETMDDDGRFDAWT